MLIRSILVLAANTVLMVGSAHSASSARLPDWACGLADPPLFMDGMEDCGHCLHSEPSQGSGGAYPGAQVRSVAGRSYYLWLPAAYSPTRAAPVLMVLHGAGGPGTAPAAAQYLRDAWAAIADTAGFIVVAPIGSGPKYGSWEPDDDYPMFQAVLNDVAAHYNIDRSRIHGWGFSAGGHVMHDLALHQRAGVPGNADFAAYAVHAGTLKALVCGYPGLPSCATALPQVARKIPVDLRVGMLDQLNYYPAMQDDYNALAAFGWAPGSTLQFTPIPNLYHEIAPSQFLATWDFLCPFQRRAD